MAELHSCASLVNASALCARNRGCSLEFSAHPAPMGCDEQDVKGDKVNIVAEISAQLQRERQKNAELMERISLLQAQIQDREKASLLNTSQVDCLTATERSFKKFKRQKIENGEVGDAETAKSPNMGDSPCVPLEYSDQRDHLVNWMSMDEMQLLNVEKFKDIDLAVDCEDTDDSDDEDDEFYDEDNVDIDDKDMEINDKLDVANTLKMHFHEEGVDGGIHVPRTERLPGYPSKPTGLSVSQEINGNQDKGCVLPDSGTTFNKTKLKRHNRRENKKIKRYKASSEIHFSGSGQESRQKGYGNLSLHKKPPKVAFCPKEVKRIIESEALLLKNAQSHTIRKIIIFASLGIRHGSEDMYELDFNHFSILRKGEPFVSPKDPGEHVLYAHPGVRRKVFYPNRQNPILCPVQILEEEKVMRPSDPSCPSCLFLCIKYGGRTRNLPQNEYVRQRMGRNKLKSFGPLICQMAMLVNIRGGSFFFKALGITLLFMAGFPDDVVQRETKYRNLDLLQKYYRTDEDAEGEELFQPYPLSFDTSSLNSQQSAGKPVPTKPSSKKQTASVGKSRSSLRSSTLPPVPSSPLSPIPFGLMGYSSLQTHAMAAFTSMPSRALRDTPTSNPMISSSSPKVSYHANHTPTQYPMFPPHPTNPFMPITCWPHMNAVPSCPYPSTYGYRSFPPSTNYISLHTLPCYGLPSSIPFGSKVVEGTGKKDTTMEGAQRDSDSSSSSSKVKKASANCK
ncbi:uncharacterized protein LOC122094430 [Macadamia integrifolia]|uniref:uncharacterized protein LOC122094430 n=1 Tax=Macadamia integrifolia TaxID=60698 RepID=UPI001C531DF8|nr:uncharacterized protein LOC122094430 [Macadamia integrifolia]